MYIRPRLKGEGGEPGQCEPEVEVQAMPARAPAGGCKEFGKES